MKTEWPNDSPKSRTSLGANWSWEHLTHNQVFLAYMFLLPTLVLLATVVAYPFFSAIWISIQDKVAGLPGKWIGFANYAELIHGENFLLVFYNTTRSSIPSSPS